MKLGAGHEVRRALINATTTAGDNQIVAADTNGRKIKVIGYVIVATAATTVTWKSATTALSGPMAFAANGGVAPPLNETTSWLETNVNEALVMTLGAGAVAGHVVYVLEA